MEGVAIKSAAERAKWARLFIRRKTGISAAATINESGTGTSFARDDLLLLVEGSDTHF